MRTAPTTVQPAPFRPETPHAASSWRTAQTPLSPASAASSPNPTHQSPAPHCTSNQAVFCRGSLNEPLFHCALDPFCIHAPQPQALKGAPFGCEIFTGHAPDHLDQRVDRWRLYSRHCTDCAHRDKTGRHVFGDEFVVERFRRPRRLIGTITVVG